jgi:hypothetical protein
VAITVTAAQQANPANGILLRVIVWTGAAAAQNGVTVSADAVQSAAITPGQTGSIVAGVSLGFPNGAYSPNGATTSLDNVNDSVNGEQYLAYFATSASVATVAETIGSGGTNPGGTALLEVKTAGSLAQDASGGSASTTGAQTISYGPFSPPSGSFITALVSSDSSGSVATMLVSGGGLIWAEVVKSNVTAHDYVGIWTAQFTAGSPYAPSQRGTNRHRTRRGHRRAAASPNPPAPFEGWGQPL